MWRRLAWCRDRLDERVRRHFLTAAIKTGAKPQGLCGGTSCALLLEVFQTSQVADRAEGYRKIHRRGRIVWVKPRMFEGLPPDVTGYGGSNPTFPQQTTSDQFFDEAQWESYRAVGYGLGETLLNGTARGIDVFLVKWCAHKQIR